MTVRRICYVMLGVVLLAAAVGKSIWLAPGSRTGLLQNPRVLAGVVALEILSAGWFFFMAPRRPAVTRLAGCSLFLMLAFFSLRAWWGGEPCHCFGTPWISGGMTFLFDIAAVILLAILPVELPERPPDLLPASGGIGASGVVGLVLAGWSLWHSPVELPANRSLDPNARFVALKPESWLGEKWPLEPYLQVDADLTQGSWLVVFYRPDCPHCRQLLPQLRRLFADRKEPPGLALIDLSGTVGLGATSHSGSVMGRLNPAKKWLAKPPFGLELSEGRVNRFFDMEALSRVNSLTFSKTETSRQKRESHSGPQSRM